MFLIYSLKYHLGMSLAIILTPYLHVKMQFYTFLETMVVAISLLPVFLVFFSDGDDDVTVSPGSLAATFVAFGEYKDTYLSFFFVCFRTP